MIWRGTYPALWDSVGQKNEKDEDSTISTYPGGSPKNLTGKSPPLRMQLLPSKSSRDGWVGSAKELLYFLLK